MTRNPVEIYLFKINNGNAQQVCEICSKLVIKTLKQCSLRRSGVYIVNFERISYVFLAFPMLTLSS